MDGTMENVMLYMAQYAGDGEGLICSLGLGGFIGALCVLFIAAIVSLILDLL